MIPKVGEIWREKDKYWRAFKIQNIIDNYIYVSHIASNYRVTNHPDTYVLDLSTGLTDYGEMTEIICPLEHFHLFYKKADLDELMVECL